MMSGERRALPPRMYSYQGRRKVTYYYISPENKRFNLGHDLNQALDQYSALNITHPNETRWAAEAHKLYAKARKNAGRRKIVFNLNIDDVIEALSATKGRCAVTGVRFSDIEVPGKRVRPYRPSIDRINSSLGYTKDNIRIVCVIANLAMNQFGEGTLFSLLAGMLEKNASGK